MSTYGHKMQINVDALSSQSSTYTKRSEIEYKLFELLKLKIKRILWTFHGVLLLTSLVL